MTGTLFDTPGPASQPAEWLTAHCDGGSRGNPGPAGYGAIIEDAHGRVVARLSEYLGKQTNNFAEYSGLIAVLKWAGTNGVRCLRILSDSELMVKQMRGQYKVASPSLKPLWEEARRLAARFDRLELKHTLREGNKEADKLANDAMDRGMGKTPGASSPSAPTPTRPSPSAPSPSGAPRSGASSSGSSPSRPAQSAPTPAASRPQPAISRPDAPRTRPTPTQPRPERQVLEGFVKGGVVHLLEGELPDGIFVKVIRE